MKKTSPHKTERRKPSLPLLQKAPTGIVGLDEITDGGLPLGRTTLICGSAGCGKTLLSMEFLVKGALEFGEPGVFIAFEETPEDLRANVASIGFDLDELIEQNLLRVDYIQLDPAEIAEAGDYDLEGLFIRLELAIQSIGAKRVAIDTLEVLFSSFKDEGILRAELRRLFNWLKSKQVSSIITAEKGNGSLTRHGLEEYVSDCVLMLDHRIHDQISTRRLRVVKYRGSRHGTNEYPFLIGDGGFTVLPITSMALNHQVSKERISTGVDRLDTMLGGKGLYRASSILLSGTAGSGKSSLAAIFTNSFCSRGERVLYYSFEESPNQIVRNMASIGLDMQQWLDKDLLRIHATRPTRHGLEMHLSIIYKEVQEYKPSFIVIDPLTNLADIGSELEVRSAINRLIDFLKAHMITALFLSLTSGTTLETSTDVGVSSLMDVWILVRSLESNGERNRGIYVLKARGMAHSNQIREFVITDHGIELLDAYIGPDGVLMGSARASREDHERAQSLVRRQEIERRQREVLRRKAALEAQIQALRAQHAAETVESELLIAESEENEIKLDAARERMATLRGRDARSVKTADRAPHKARRGS